MMAIQNSLGKDVFGFHSLSYVLPTCMVFFSKTNQIPYLEDFPIISDCFSVVVTEHLVDFTENNSQIGFRNPFLEGCERSDRAGLVHR